MSELCKCPGEGCPVRDKCYRYTSEAKPLQSYFVGNVRNSEPCSYFIDNEKFKDDKVRHVPSRPPNS